MILIVCLIERVEKSMLCCFQVVRYVCGVVESIRNDIDHKHYPCVTHCVLCGFVKLL